MSFGVVFNLGGWDTLVDSVLVLHANSTDENKGIVCRLLSSYLFLHLPMISNTIYFAFVAALLCSISETEIARNPTIMN